MFPHEITVKWDEGETAYVAKISAVRVTAKGDTPDGAVRAALIAAGAEVPSERSAAAAAMGRAGGAKGGKARAASLSKAKRAEIAKKAAKARWGK
ncbi:MAG TPA: histone H1 [Polyangia bacterium]|nr:histone H1 [Polyangia bacterium]